MNGQPSPNQVHTALIRVLLFQGPHQIRERQATTGVKSLHASFNVTPASVKQTKYFVPSWKTAEARLELQNAPPVFHGKKLGYNSFLSTEGSGGTGGCTPSILHHHQYT
ncbi:hypothetical protein TEQG_04853 [Trichophyton equinum CBS 127.97]|uniref:Uncharacterized protein n=1 Tax=Trichophyton equinum (strain ATCC MYA-4606 / CBS 127.97) TaxID=559882 RepID=F2PVC5_TRIEC|nr:hypothetical protein TEQG_04853 [Trichophyton equinum CBS 127.97]